MLSAEYWLMLCFFCNETKWQGDSDTRFTWEESKQLNKDTFHRHQWIRPLISWRTWSRAQFGLTFQDQRCVGAVGKQIATRKIITFSFALFSIDDTRKKKKTTSRSSLKEQTCSVCPSTRASLQCTCRNHSQKIRRVRSRLANLENKASHYSSWSLFGNTAQ